MPTGKIIELPTALDPGVVIVDMGGEDTIACRIVTPPNVDASPVLNDDVVVTGGLGDEDVTCMPTGYTGDLDPGARESYGRAPNGTVVSTIRQAPNGDVEISGPVINALFAANGALSINAGLASIEISATGTITLSSGAGTLEINPALGVRIDGTLFRTHIHAAPTGPTGPPTGP